MGTMRATKNDDEIVATLQREGHRLQPTALAELLDRLTGGKLSQGTIVTYFKRAFPAIPLRVLLETAGWHRVGGGMLNDEQFNAALRPWTTPAP
jgi:hypothetical protein